MNGLMSTAGYYGSNLPSFGGTGATNTQFETGLGTGLTIDQIKGLLADKAGNQQMAMQGATSGLGAQAQATPTQSLMGMAQSGAGQQPYQDFMPQEYYPYLRGLMGG